MDNQHDQVEISNPETERKELAGSSSEVSEPTNMPNAEEKKDVVGENGFSKAEENAHEEKEAKEEKRLSIGDVGARSVRKLVFEAKEDSKTAGSLDENSSPQKLSNESHKSPILKDQTSKVNTHASQAKSIQKTGKGSSKRGFNVSPHSKEKQEEKENASTSKRMMLTRSSKKRVQDSDENSNDHEGALPPEVSQKIIESAKKSLKAIMEFNAGKDSASRDQHLEQAVEGN